MRSGEEDGEVGREAREPQLKRTVSLFGKDLSMGSQPANHATSAADGELSSASRGSHMTAWLTSRFR